MRGTRHRDPRPVLEVGIIPADAGSTGKVKSTNTYIEDHPRGCGEHRVSRELEIGERGSSPRMRGARR